MKLKLTPQEKAWVLYDVANSAFIMLVTTIIPIFFNYLADNAGLSDVDYLAYWGYAASVVTLVVALTGPILGSLADHKGFKKPIFCTFIGIGVMGCAMLGFITSWLAFLLVFVIAKVGYSSSLIFYDSMLTDITKESRMDEVSSIGFALGYIGSCIPFIASLVIVLNAEKLGLTMTNSMVIAFLINAVWWLVCSCPLIKGYKQKHYVTAKDNILLSSFKRLWETLKNMRKEKAVFLFLLAYFFYIDGVYTIIDMATAYGQALGLDSTQLLLALLVTQLVAFPCCLVFGRLSKKYDSARLITICILAYTAIAIYAIFLHTQIQFWVLAICVGVFQGGIQALSRSYFAKIISPEKSGEYFGILDICGKGASFMGTALISVGSQITGSINGGIGVLSLLFLVGLVLFRKAVRTP